MQLASELGERTKWEALRLNEFLTRKEKEVADKLSSFTFLTPCLYRTSIFKRSTYPKALMHPEGKLVLNHYWLLSQHVLCIGHIDF